MTPTEALADMQPRLERLVRRKAGSLPALHDDLVQEAMLAAWAELEKGAPQSHAMQAAKFRVLKIVVEGKPFTGEPRHAGVRDGADDALRLVMAVNDDDDEESYLVEPVDAATEAAMALVEDPTTRARVRAAVTHLNEAEREYVFLRFWAGLEPTSRVPEIRARLREFPVMSRRGLWDRARVKLRTELADVA